MVSPKSATLLEIFFQTSANDCLYRGAMAPILGYTLPAAIVDCFFETEYCAVRARDAPSGEHRMWRRRGDDSTGRAVPEAVIDEVTTACHDSMSWAALLSGELCWQGVSGR